MNSDRWQQVSKLYHDALARDASARDAFLRDACAGDEALRREVEALLNQPASAADLVEDPPPVRLTSRMVADAGAPPPMAGRRLGGYQVETRLGAGGMGEVYRARDTKLGRQVAIKILPRVFTSDPERLARFEREARMLASLNHPNIGAIFGVEDAEGIRALVLELVEGEMMTERIARGPIPIKDALGMARQIADALDAAHERGIVHRDLKPANIKITPAGVVKVLDFGLAKAGGTGDSDSAVNLTNSPTLTMGETRDGMILGTAPYMSPEQARGRVVDKRTDVWAFGCVLYEMLTGRVAFAGGTVSDTIVAILDRDPDWGRLPPETPPSLMRLLQRCLEKDAKRRLHDIADARIEIDDALQEPIRPASGILPPAVATRSRPLRLTAAAMLLALAIGAGLTWWFAAPASLSAPSLARVMVTLPAGQALEKGRFSPIALSPDGQLLVYAAAVGGGQTQLYLRALDELEARPIPATEGATTPFFSPDGRWLGFYSESSLKKVSLAGGVPLTIGETPPIWSATWGGDDHIVFATTLASSGLWDVPADGGEPVQITTPKEGETQHGYPQSLPGGTHLLFSVLGDGAWRPALLTLANREWRLLGNGRVVGEGARYLPTGHLVYAQAGGLVAAPFDPPDGDLNQPPTPLLERVERSRFGGAYFSVAAAAGSLVYLPANTAVTERTLLRVDREGRVVPLLDARLGYEDVAFSPDGRRVAATIESDTGRDIWIIDVERGTRIRFTTGGTSAFPVWSPDGSRLAFQSTAPGLWNLYWKPLDGSSEAQPVIAASPQPAASWPNTDSNLLPGTLPTLSGANPQFPTSWTADGSLAFHERKPNGERDIWVVAPSSDPLPFLLTPFDERSPRFSPDGKWLTYVSNESGRDEVYVQPFPGPGRKWLISTDGGIDPVWARDGRELFYRQGEQMMAVSIVPTPEFQAGRPRRLFETRFDTADNGRSYDLAPDGTWFLMPRSDRAPAPAELHFVLNWFNEVTSRTSTAR